MATTTGSWSTTKASVPTKNVELFCFPFGGMNSNGIFAGEDPMEFPVPLLLFQLGLFTLVCRSLQILLKPFKQHIFVPQVLSGIVLGPSFLGRNDIFRNKIFTEKSLQVLDVYALIGYMFLVFLAGVRTNLRIIKKCGRLGFIIGFGSFILPSIITSSMAFFLRKTVHMDLDLRHALPLVAMFEAATSFHVTHGLLTDLKLLNSELGRLALSSSLISGFCSWAYTLIVIFVAEISPPHSKFMAFATNLCKVVMVTTIIFIFRPIMFWMIKQTPEGKTLKESYILAITLTVFGCALFGEVMGIDYLLGPVVFGLAVPDGPPVGSSIVEKLDGFVSAVFLPCYIMSLGRKVDVFLIGGNNFMIVAFIVLVATLVKLLAIMIPSLYFKMPILDALSLSLILNCRGYFDIAFFERARDVKMITEESFIIMVIMAMLNTATFTPLVGALYDPSKRYVAYKRRTIQHSRRNAELRILACIHQPDDVPTIINILETSNPTRQSPIGVYVLDMVKLQSGHATSQLINHRYDKSPTRITSRISHIIKAFRRYELHNQGIVTIQCFTTISPYATMHDDICALALEKSTSLVIIPFRVSFSMSMRTMNKNVLENAPCSVGILIDRRMATGL
ncbi:hypothetical protein L1049_007839 [Liquidambar formosana]|uniref:Cation/H+ exchanger domain-containing protein n=1 Tax=Liquidambar formosana TaxID=63359 RepID=A0AAP0S8X2_LIQFO